MSRLDAGALSDVREADEEPVSEAGGHRGKRSVTFKFQITVRGSGCSEELGSCTPCPSPEPRGNQLPPLALDGDAGNCSALVERRGMETSLRTTRPWSRYHRSCVLGGPDYFDWTSTKKQFWKPNRTNKDNRQIKELPSTSKYVTSTRMGDEVVIQYLDSNPDFLSRYIMENVPVDTLERFIIRKIKNDRDMSAGPSTKSSLSRWNFCVHADKRRMLEDITSSLQDHQTIEQVLFELGCCISDAVGVDNFYIFKVKLGDPERLDILKRKNDEKEVQMFQLDTSLYKCLMHVATKRGPTRYSWDSSPLDHILHSYSGAKHVMFVPIVQPNGETVAVLEMARRYHRFHEEDEEISSSYLVWGGIALHYATLYHDMQMQRSMANFLLDIVKSIFQNMVSIEPLVTKVMNFAQNLVNAERASLFLIDSKSQELLATVFDIGSEKGPCTSGMVTTSSKSLKKEIRLGLGTGIAGHVAETGEVLNIRNAYEDVRFNRNVDIMTGFKTKTILCMPIYIGDTIIGVVQMVNKIDGFFTKEDEKAFEMFAVYCGLALHHTKLYNKIVRSEQKYKVALEVLSYHSTCNDEDVNRALNDIDVKSKYIEKMANFNFDPFIITDHHKAVHAVHMFVQMFGLEQFDRIELVKFVLTVKKNYRRVPYHNWTHGFSVANTMYNILKRESKFTRNERLATFIGSLCHDLDHRGKSNKFMLETAAPLASIYSTSTMEHHHFNQTITILQQEGHNIFSRMSSEDYKTVLGLVRHCILATDLALFFPNKKNLEKILNDGLFSWNNPEHRQLVMAVAMTAADLSASAKPWDVQVETVKVIFQEFYQQGDEERAAGREPDPVMDRVRPEKQAASQVDFLANICLPCYSLLVRVLPESQPLLTGCQRNLQRWRSIQQEIAQVVARRGIDSALPEHLYLKIKKP